MSTQALLLIDSGNKRQFLINDDICLYDSFKYCCLLQVEGALLVCSHLWLQLKDRPYASDEDTGCCFGTLDVSSQAAIFSRDSSALVCSYSQA